MHASASPHSEKCYPDNMWPTNPRQVKHCPIFLSDIHDSGSALLWHPDSFENTRTMAMEWTISMHYSALVGRRGYDNHCVICISSKLSRKTNINARPRHGYLDLDASASHEIHQDLLLGRAPVHHWLVDGQNVYAAVISSLLRVTQVSKAGLAGHRFEHGVHATLRLARSFPMHTNLLLLEGVGHRTRTCWILLDEAATSSVDSIRVQHHL